MYLPHNKTSDMYCGNNTLLCIQNSLNTNAVYFKVYSVFIVNNTEHDQDNYSATYFAKKHIHRINKFLYKIWNIYLIIILYIYI